MPKKSATSTPPPHFDDRIAGVQSKASELKLRIDALLMAVGEPPPSSSREQAAMDTKQREMIEGLQRSSRADSRRITFAQARAQEAEFNTEKAEIRADEAEARTEKVKRELAAALGNAQRLQDVVRGSLQGVIMAEIRAEEADDALEGLRAELESLRGEFTQLRQTHATTLERLADATAANIHQQESLAADIRVERLRRVQSDLEDVLEPRDRTSSRPASGPMIMA